jgi:sulfite exporter TauE/SafE
MEHNVSLLAGTAITVGILHTLAGPDHYLPFVALSKSRNWGLLRTVNMVALCGTGHVLGSIVIGFIGIAAGIAVSGIEKTESYRGNIAAWLMLLFGVVYMVWGAYRLWHRRNHPHLHHSSGTNNNMTFWILFAIFVFGPCEPLIPILMVPAASQSYGVVTLVALLFALSTIITMILMVLLMLKGVSFIKLGKLEKYQHIIAGGTVALCGFSILFLGL